MLHYYKLHSTAAMNAPFKKYKYEKVTWRIFQVSVQRISGSNQLIFPLNSFPKS